MRRRMYRKCWGVLRVSVMDSKCFPCYRPGGIPARSEKGERLLLFIGIIDILQSYRLKKKLEHTFKSIIHDGVSDCCCLFGTGVHLLIRKFLFWFKDTVSVCRPSFYAQRFQDFMAKTVFRKIPSRKFTLVPVSWQMHNTKRIDSEFLRKFIFEKQRHFWISRIWCFYFYFFFVLLLAYCFPSVWDLLRLTSNF